VSVRVYFDPHDLWIGVFWRRRYIAEPWAVYICPIPTLVIRLRGVR
jgi:hypothetical protein